MKVVVHRDTVGWISTQLLGSPDTLFVEIENDKGESISSSWTERGDGYWEIELDGGRSNDGNGAQAAKAARHRQRLLDKAKEYQTSTYVRKFVAPIFQRMIRAEAGAEMCGTAVVIVDGELDVVERKRGQCACVTCGAVKAWDSGIRGMHCGHFIASRRNSILFEEDNVAPQCSHCNYYGSGRAQEFRKWMLDVRGLAVVERLERLKTESRQFCRDELVDLRIGYAARLKAAQQAMKGS
tara:strand:- start:467 stop:1183 length:717 start_codon:yes stop_codon:yes gene_type:complete